MKRTSIPLGVIFAAVAVYLVGAGVSVILGRASLMSAAWLLQGLEVMGPFVFFLIAAAAAVVAYGVVRGATWARRAGVVLIAVFVFSAVPGVSSAVASQQPWPIALQAAKLMVAVALAQRLWRQHPPTTLFER